MPGDLTLAADQMSLAETSDGPLVLQMDTFDEWGTGGERESRNRRVEDVQTRVESKDKAPPLRNRRRHGHIPSGWNNY